LYIVMKEKKRQRAMGDDPFREILRVLGLSWDAPVKSERRHQRRWAQSGSGRLSVIRSADPLLDRSNRLGGC
jgi:hypothetical protein